MYSLAMSLTKKNIFFFSLLLVTIAPIIWFPTSGYFVSSDQAIAAFIGLRFLAAGFHVSTTGFFWFVPETRRMFLDQSKYFVIIPIFLIGTLTLSFQFLPNSISSLILAVYFVWQLWHYQMQNIGLLSFFSVGGQKLDKEKVLLKLGALAGILGFFKFAPIDIYGKYLAFSIGQFLYLIIAGLFIYLIIKRKYKSWKQIVILTVTTFFFLPTYLFNDAQSAIVGYAFGHGFQYIVFMLFLTGFKKSQLLLLLLVGIIGGCFMNFKIEIAPGFFGFYLGFTITHFIADARIWKLRGEPTETKKFIKERFTFLRESV